MQMHNVISILYTFAHESHEDIYLYHFISIYIDISIQYVFTTVKVFAGRYDLAVDMWSCGVVMYLLPPGREQGSAGKCRCSA